MSNRVRKIRSAAFKGQSRKESSSLLNYVFSSVLILLILWVVAGPHGLWKLHRLGMEKKALYMQNIRLMEQNTQLESAIKALKTDPKFQEQMVRQKLGWVRDGELIYRFSD